LQAGKERRIFHNLSYTFKCAAYKIIAELKICISKLGFVLLFIFKEFLPLEMKVFRFSSIDTHMTIFHRS